jgi:hypothetical protein
MGLISFEISYVGAAIYKKHSPVTLHLPMPELPFVFCPVTTSSIEDSSSLELVVLPLAIVLH